MANQQRQGTGHHGHKDTKEPWPHTQGSQGSERQQSQSHSGGERQHSQSHTGGERQQHQQQHGGGSGGRQQQQQSTGRSEQESLKDREYRDENGEIHHHTKTYMEQHGKEGGQKDR